MSDATRVLENSNDRNLADCAIGRHLREGRGAETALMFDGVAYAYRELAGAAMAFRRRLEPLVKPGDRVAILLPDCPNFAGAFFGAIAIGAVASPVNANLAPQDLALLLRRLSPSVLVTGSAPPSMLHDLFGELGCRVLRADVEGLETSSEAWDSIPLVGAERDGAYCLFSSGTSGEPKGVVHDHLAVHACLAAFEGGVLQILPTDRILAVPKLTFGYGLVGNLLFGLLAGACSILLPRPHDITAFSRAIERDRPSLLLAQPRVLLQMLESEVPPSALASVRVCFSAGEVLWPSLYDRWVRRYRIPLIDAVGSTELGHVFIANRPGEERPGSAGRLLPGFEGRIVGENGADAVPGECGELHVRGPSMTRLYCNDPVRTAELASRGWVYTGDVFSRSVDGYYTMHGRVDDLIKVGCGQWMVPAEIEEVLAIDPEVAESAVVSETSPHGIVRPLAYIVPVHDAVDLAGLVERLRLATRARWPAETHKHIDDFRVVARLPRTVNGKVARVVLRERGAPQRALGAPINGAKS